MLTVPQLAALKAAILANSTWNAFPVSGDGYYNLAGELNLEASPAFWVWSSRVDVAAIKAAIVWANLTPADVPDGTQQWANRSLQCQGKQFNLQLILPQVGGIGSVTFNATDINLRAGLQDALTGVRSGAAGAAQSAGWTAVQNILARRAKFGEKILADTSLGDGSTRALSANLVLDGNITPEDVQAARNS